MLLVFYIEVFFTKNRSNVHYLFENTLPYALFNIISLKAMN